MPNGLDLASVPASAVDAELVARIASGDRLAERALVQRYIRPILAVLNQRLHQPELARDLAQETFIIAMERLRGDGVDDPERLAGFLRQTAINLAIGEKRKVQRRRTDADSDGLAAAVDDSAGPLALLEQQQVTTLVRQLIAELPVPRDRDLLWRHYVLDHDKADLCRDYELSAEHFDRVLHRARSRLRELAERNHTVP
ncbi:RNA polymerase sigma factor [Tahibacter amnicola]|uniref:Sigma-70 family RNA polymerase sigma factor n=1 Tax=Tahibacter amnicola TaxID=2976241 RepID=A0ABY6BIB8_9GAMM|nr:sigma-70 family RNA polymerase sigma factor [Tahibacter amnicola]UXI69756.1 sigma-70 family RNA polymerase sigma factor [Tahibacter amnicola]